MTSDPTSDSSDTGGSGKCNDEVNTEAWRPSDIGDNTQTFIHPANVNNIATKKKSKRESDLGSIGSDNVGR